MQDFPSYAAHSALQLANPWWSHHKGVSVPWSRWSPRPYLEALRLRLEELQPQRAFVVCGARRVGKSTLALHAIARRLDAGLDPATVAWIPLSSPLFLGCDLERALDAALTARGGTQPFALIVVDDLQHMPHAAARMAALARAHPNACVIGISSGKLSLGPELVDVFTLPPLTFSEHLELRRERALLAAASAGPDAPREALERLHQRYEHYLATGGFPELSDACDASRFTAGLDLCQRLMPSSHTAHAVGTRETVLLRLLWNAGREARQGELRMGTELGAGGLERLLDELRRAQLFEPLSLLVRPARNGHVPDSFVSLPLHTSLRAMCFGPPSHEGDDAAASSLCAIAMQMKPELRPRLRASASTLIECVDKNHYLRAVCVRGSDRVLLDRRELTPLSELLASHPELRSLGATSRSTWGSVKLAGRRIEVVPNCVYAFLEGSHAARGRCLWEELALEGASLREHLSEAGRLELDSA